MFYSAVRGLARLVLRALFDVRVSGREHLPREGPYVICANHVSWWDPVLIATSVPHQVFFMAKEELFRYPVLGWLLRMLGAFPVRRGTADRAAIRRSLEVLERRGVLGVFPEGTRSRTGRLQEGQGGAAFIAMKANVPIVPMAVSSRYRVGGSCQLIIGKPFRFERGEGRATAREEVEAASLRIMGEIEGLMDERRTLSEDKVG